MSVNALTEKEYDKRGSKSDISTRNTYCWHTEIILNRYQFHLLKCTIVCRCTCQLIGTMHEFINL